MTSIFAPDEEYQRSGFWSFPGKQDFGYALLLMGVGLSLYGIGRFNYPHVLLPLLVIFAGFYVTTQGWTLWTKARKEAEAAMMGGADWLGQLPSQFHTGGEVNPQVRRVLEVVNATWPEVVVPHDWDSWKIDDDGNLLRYSLRATRSGYFSEEGVQSRVFNKLRGSLKAEVGSWELIVDMDTDTITMTQESSFPAMVTPPNWHVVQSEKEAREFYPRFEYAIGVNKHGTQIRFAPGAGFPHLGMYGTTGGGKSVATRAILEQFRAAGFMIFAVDGKGTDYSAMMRQNGVVAVSTTIPDHVALVHMVRKIMDQRRAIGAKLAKAGDATWRDKQTPLVLVLDEFATVVNDMKAAYPKDYKLFMKDIASILKVGREFRCSVVLATQDMKAETVPSDWQAMFAVNICMGRPDDMTLNKGFPEAVRGEARLKGDTISKKTRGRGVVAVTTESGSPTVELFQSYFSYSPAEDINTVPSSAKDAWLSFKSAVSDRIPRLYSRLWFKPEYPEPEDGKDPYADARRKSEENGGIVDMSLLSVEDIHRLKPVVLKESAPGVVAEGLRQYDPLDDDHYLARDLILAGDDIDLST